MKSKIFEYICVFAMLVGLGFCVLYGSNFMMRSSYQEHAMKDAPQLLKSAQTACRDHVEYLIIYDDARGIDYEPHAKADGGWFTC